MEVRICVWHRDNILKKLESGEIDMICQAQRTPEREERFLLSKYWAGTEACVLYARMDDDRYYYNDFEAFNGIRVQDWRKVFRMMIWKNMLKRMIFRLSWKNTWRQKNVFRHWRKVLWMQSYRDRLSGWTIIRLSAGLEHSHFIWWQESKAKGNGGCRLCAWRDHSGYPTFLSELYQKYMEILLPWGLHLQEKKLNILGHKTGEYSVYQ